MKRVLTAIILIPIVLVIVLRAPVPLMAALVAGVALLATREFLDIARHYGVQPFRLPTYIFVVLPFLAIALEGVPKPMMSTAVMMYAVGLAAVFAPFVFLVVGMTRRDLSSAFPAAGAAVFAFVYAALPLALLVQVRQHWAGAFLILYLLLVVWVGDIAAYYVGRALGHHLLAPHISPKKTWEGALASFAASMVVGIWMFTRAYQVSGVLLRAGLLEREQGYFAPEHPPIWVIVLLTALINGAAQLGDLVESLLKRGAGVKDSGTILPGHGGMLDRIDALLFAAPVLWYYAAWRVLA